MRFLLSPASTGPAPPLHPAYPKAFPSVDRASSHAQRSQRSRPFELEQVAWASSARSQGSRMITHLQRAPGVLAKAVSLRHQQHQRRKIGAATRADARVPKARMTNGAAGKFLRFHQRPPTKKSSSRRSAAAFFNSSGSFAEIAALILSCSPITSSLSSGCILSIRRRDCSIRPLASPSAPAGMPETGATCPSASWAFPGSDISSPSRSV